MEQLTLSTLYANVRKKLNVAKLTNTPEGYASAGRRLQENARNPQAFELAGYYFIAAAAVSAGASRAEMYEGNARECFAEAGRQVCA